MRKKGGEREGRRKERDREKKGGREERRRERGLVEDRE